ncbi:MAG: hypothetical protein H7230_04675 [Candidatus Parcubacteria bacterium]|nr:hypothetical protein [Candidatus Paceibacterota bacterium]
MTFSRLLASLTRYTRIILILGLIVLAGAGSQIGGVNVYAGTVENGCKDGKPPIVKGGVQICTLKYDNGTKGVFNTEATFVDNKFTGLQNCYLGADKGSAVGNNCAGFAVVGLNIGDNIREINAVDDGGLGSEQAGFKILNANAVGNDPKNFSGNKCSKEEKLDTNHVLYTCKDSFIVQNVETGKFSVELTNKERCDKLVSAPYAWLGCKAGTVLTPNRSPEEIKADFKNGQILGKDSKLVDKSTLGGLAPSQIGTLKPEQAQAVNDQMTVNQGIIDAGAQATPLIVIVCEVPRFDKTGNISSVCKGGDGKYYTKDANGKLIALKDKCIGVTRDANKRVVNECYTEDLNKVDAALPINATLQPIADANKKEKADLAGVTGDKSNSALDLVKSLGAIVGWVLFFLIYFFGWILSFLLYMISVLFVEILSINPAAPAFIGAAVRPWQVLVGLANLLVLGTFIAIGLAYILDYKPLKRNIREFILQIAVFALLLQFSLLGTGVVVNLATGIGDAMVYSYAGPSKITGRPNYSRLIGGFVKAINNISAVRCGKSVEATKKAEFCDVDVSSVPFETDGKNENGVNNIGDSFKNIGTFLGDTTKGPAENALFDAGIQGILLQYLLFESIYVLVMFYAITQMFQALGLVIFRLVGLWMLMVTSPVALALYLAPAKSLQKYATEWLDKFWKATFFYPFFILALVLHTKLVSAIAVALNVGQTLSKGTDTGDISPLSMAVIVAAGTLAGVSIVGLALVIKWFKDSFGAIVEAAMKGLGKAFGALRMATTTAGTVGKGIGGGIGRTLDGSKWGQNISKWRSNTGAKLDKAISGTNSQWKKLGLNAMRGGVTALSAQKLLSAPGNMLRLGAAAPGFIKEGAKDLWKYYGDQNGALLETDREVMGNFLERTLRTVPGAKAIAGAAGLNLDAFKGTNRYRNKNPMTLLNPEGRDKLEKSQAKRMQDIYDKKMNISNDLPTETLELDLDDMEKVLIAKGGYANINSSERSNFDTLVDNIFKKNPALAKKRFISGPLKEAVSTQFSEGYLNDDSRKTIYENYPILNKDDDAVVAFASQLSKREFEALDPDQLNDPRVQKGLIPNPNVTSEERNARRSYTNRPEAKMSLDNSPYMQSINTQLRDAPGSSDLLTIKGVAEQVLNLATPNGLDTTSQRIIPEFEVKMQAFMAANSRTSLSPSEQKDVMATALAEKYAVDLGVSLTGLSGVSDVSGALRSNLETEISNRMTASGGTMTRLDVLESIPLASDIVKKTNYGSIQSGRDKEAILLEGLVAAGVAAYSNLDINAQAVSQSGQKVRDARKNAEGLANAYNNASSAFKSVQAQANQAAASNKDMDLQSIPEAISIPIGVYAIKSGIQENQISDNIAGISLAGVPLERDRKKIASKLSQGVEAFAAADFQNAATHFADFESEYTKAGGTAPSASFYSDLATEIRQSGREEIQEAYTYVGQDSKKLGAELSRRAKEAENQGRKLQSEKYIEEVSKSELAEVKRMAAPFQHQPAAPLPVSAATQIPSTFSQSYIDQALIQEVNRQNGLRPGYEFNANGDEILTTITTTTLLGGRTQSKETKSGTGRRLNFDQNTGQFTIR